MQRRAGFLLGATAAALSLAATTAFAQQAAVERLDRLFERIDLDASGTLTAVEVRAAAAARFGTLDLDGDGVVTWRERRESRRNRLEELFERADTNRDGLVDIEELQEMAKRRARRRLARLDADGNGMLSLDELQNGRFPYIAEADRGVMTLADLEARMMALFSRADADRDGIVTLDEVSRGAER